MPRFSGITDGSVLASQNLLVATTLPKMQREIVDTFFKQTPFFFWMRSKNRIRQWSGGESYEARLMYGKNPYASAYNDYEVANVGPATGFGNAVYQRAKYRVPIMYAGSTLDANSGDAAIANLVEDLKTQAQKSLVDLINGDFLNSQVGDSAVDFSKITSLYRIIERELETDQEQIIGGIAKDKNGTYPFWYNQYTSHAGTATNLLPDIRKNAIACADGTDGPDLGLCDETTYAKLEDQAFAKRYFTNADVADFGFQNVLYNGCTYMLEKGVTNDDDNDGTANESTEGSVFHINSKYLFLAVSPGYNFKVIAPQYDPMQDLWIGFIYVHLQAIATNLQRQGVVKGTAYTA